jgi:hypothetical protein
MYRSQNPLMSEAIVETNLIRKSAHYKFVEWIPTGIKLGTLK